MKINIKISSKNEGKVKQLNDGKLSDKNRKVQGNVTNQEDL